jgi:hypothetical protein
LTTAINTKRKLNTKDRCDVCNAQAKVVATFINGELLFCGHHAREAGNKLLEQAVHVYDPEDKLNLLK